MRHYLPLTFPTPSDSNIELGRWDRMTYTSWLENGLLDRQLYLTEKKVEHQW